MFSLLRAKIYFRIVFRNSLYPIIFNDFNVSRDRHSKNMDILRFIAILTSRVPMVH